MEEKAKAIVELYVSSGKAALRSKQSSNIPPDFRLLDGLSFKIVDLESKTVCQGVIREDEGQRSRMFKCKMTGSSEELTLCQADLCAKLGLKPTYTLTQNIILEVFELTLNQLSARVGRLLPTVVVTTKPLVTMPKASQGTPTVAVSTTCPSQAAGSASLQTPSMRGGKSTTSSTLATSATPPQSNA